MQFSEKYDFLKDDYSKRLKLAEQIEKAETLSERNRLKAEYKQKFHGEEYIDTKSLEKRKKHNKELNNNQITLEIIKTVLEHPDDIEKEYAKYFANENSGIYKTNPNNKKGRNKQPSIFGPTKFVASKVIEVAKLYLASIPLISQIKGAYGKYTTGDAYADAELSKNGIMKDINIYPSRVHQNYDPNNPKILRTCYLYKGDCINDNKIFDHYDTAKINLEFDIEKLLDRKMYTNNDVDRYKCSNKQYHPKVSDIFVVKNEQLYIDSKKFEKINRHPEIHADTFIITDSFKNEILKKFEKITDHNLKCVEKNSIDKIFIDMLLHTVDIKIDKKNYQYQIENFTPKDFKNIFKKIMLQENIKNIHIYEKSCFYNNELIEVLAGLIKETGFDGNIIVRRNKFYNKKFGTSKEITFKMKDTNNMKKYDGIKENIFTTTGEEYILCNKEGCKCITENEAREIMGGSYKQNLDFNKKHGLGDEQAHKKCQLRMNLINKKYFHNHKNMSNKTCNINNSVKDCTGVTMP